MVLGYEHNLVKGKLVKHESEQVQLIRKQGKDANVAHNNVTVNTMFMRKRPSSLSSLDALLANRAIYLESILVFLG